MTPLNPDLLNRLLHKMIENKWIYSCVLCVQNGDASFSWTGAAGSMEKDSRYFIASVTKLYVTAIIMSLVEKKRIALDDKISKYLPESICQNLHILKGIDYSDDISIYHLISNTSGLPDYFFHKQLNGRTVADDLLEGNDQSWHLDKTINLIKELKPNFKPGARGKAAYSDSNYQLLGRIIENVVGKDIGRVFQDFITSELGLKNTYVYHDIKDDTPVPFYYKSRKLWLPNYIVSISSEGGIISTVDEVMKFLKAFFSGRFFPIGKIDELKKWNLILPPPGLFYFGVGLEKLWTPWIISPLKPIKEITGFWGQTGSFAFYNSQTDLYFCGTTNQINGAGHRAATRTMLKIIKSAA